MSDWQRNLGFADRLNVVTKLQASLQEAEPGLSPSQAGHRAQEEEAEYLGRADSLEAYERFWTARLHELQLHALMASPPSPFTAESHSLSPNEHTAIIGNYTAQPFASGLTATVYMAVLTSCLNLPNKAHGGGEVVALKVTTPHMLTPPHNSLLESRLLAQLRTPTHPKNNNILPYISSFSPPASPSTHVLVTPFLPIPLSSLFHQPIFTPLRARRVLHDLFNSLKFLHECTPPVLHRDIKPSNILLASMDPGTPAYLADFGIAYEKVLRAKDGEEEDTKVTDVGTTHYRAPELLFGYRSYGVGVDLWAAGCVVYECFHPRHEPLFDAGDLGSDLRLVGSHLEVLGMPREEEWPSRALCPDWGKLAFEEKKGTGWIWEGATEKELEVLAGLVKFEWTRRMGAREVLGLAYFGEGEKGS